MRPDIDHVLAEREAQVLAQLATLTKPTAEVGDISFGKRVGDGTAMAVDRLTAVSAQEQLLSVLDQVRHARRRLADGSYGRCEVCGEPIPEERLEARPGRFGASPTVDVDTTRDGRKFRSARYAHRPVASAPGRSRATCR